jgi:hypothetical protein
LFLFYDMFRLFIEPSSWFFFKLKANLFTIESYIFQMYQVWDLIGYYNDYLRLATLDKHNFQL